MPAVLLVILAGFLRVALFFGILIFTLVKKRPYPKSSLLVIGGAVVLLAEQLGSTIVRMVFLRSFSPSSIPTAWR